MRQVLIVDDAEIHAKELAEMLRAHHIVVLNALMRGRPEKLREEVIVALKDWQGRSPFIRYDEPVVSVNGDPCWMPTMIHEDLNALGFSKRKTL